MPDTYEQNLSNKASLTRSDYIRVVGTDNVSYKQPISNVMRTIATYPYDYVESTGSFLDWVKATFTENGNYYVVMATDNWTGWCTNAIGTCIVQKRNADWYLLAMTHETAVTDNLAIYINQTTGSSWVGWSKLPTRGEINALNSKTGNAKIIYTSKTITLAAGSSANPSETNVDFSDVISTGSVLGIDVFLGGYHLPYVMAGGVVGTWISGASGKQITIKNAASAWNSYTLYACIICTNS